MMERMKTIALILLCGMMCTLSAVAQADLPDPVEISVYYAGSGQITTKDKALFRRVVHLDWQEMVFTGAFRDYDMKDKLIADGYYEQGQPAGFYSEYHEDGSTRMSVEYDTNHDFIIWQLTNLDKSFTIAKGSGSFAIDYYYFLDWRLKPGTMTGEFLNGRRVGTWLYTDGTHRLTDKENYRDGQLVSRVYYRGKDSVILHFKKDIVLSPRLFASNLQNFDLTSFPTAQTFLDSTVQYPSNYKHKFTYFGGLKKFLRMVSQAAAVPEHGLVLVRLKIDEHGKVLKSSVVRSVDDDTDERALKAVLSHASHFLPPVQNGKPVATVVYIPVATGEEWNQMLDNAPEDWFLDVNNFY